MALTCLKPRLKTLNTSVVKVLDHKAGSTQRSSFRKRDAMRKEVLQRDGYACQKCGRVSLHNEVDHVVPLDGGGADDPSNMQTLCHDDHAAKTAAEQRARFGR